MYLDTLFSLIFICSHPSHLDPIDVAFSLLCAILYNIAIDHWQFVIVGRIVCTHWVYVLGMTSTPENSQTQGPAQQRAKILAYNAHPICGHNSKKLHRTAFWCLEWVVTLSFLRTSPKQPFLDRIPPHFVKARAPCEHKIPYLAGPKVSNPYLHLKSIDLMGIALWYLQSGGIYLPSSYVFWPYSQLSRCVVKRYWAGVACGARPASTNYVGQMTNPE